MSEPDIHDMRNMMQVKILNLFDWYKRGAKPSNKKLIRSFRNSTLSAKCLFFVSPGDFNSIEDHGLMSDKTAYIGKILQSNGYECAYLMREVLSSNSKIPKRVTIWPYGAITQKLHIRRFILATLLRSFRSLKKMDFDPISEKSSRTAFGEFLFSTMQSTLKELNPNVVFTIGATQELLEICQQLGIKVIEVMHGVFNETEIPRDFLKASNYKPDIFLTWHASYSELLTKNGINSITLGHPNLKFSNPVLKKREPSPNYLITLEHSISNSEDEFGMFERELFSFVKCLSVQEVNMIFRVHPVIASQQKLFLQVEKWLLSNFEKCSIESPLQVNLFESLSKVKVQISYRSSTFFEAALLGVPTVLIGDLSLRQIPDELITANYVHQAKQVKNMNMSALVTHELKPLDFIMREEKLLEIMKLALNN